jgi:hypothetical protein
MQQGKVIGNVGLLDLRKATETSIAEIRRIGNVGMVFYSRETADLVTQLSIGNVGTTLEVSPDAKIMNGPMVFTRDYFRHQEASLDLLVNGPVMVEPDVSAQEIEQGLGELSINGPLLCPDHLMGIMQSKIRHMNGPMISYTSSSRVIMGRLDLDERTLRALEDGTALVVMGSLRLPEVLPDDLLAQKIQKLQVFGSIRCHEENAQVILGRMPEPTVKIKPIPAGFALVDRPLILDDAVLESLSARRLYCTDRIQIDLGVDDSLLDERVEALVSEDVVICPASLTTVLSRKCDLLKARVIFYEGELWMIDDEADLLASRFDYLEGKATLVVYGDLTVSPQIAPRVLADRLARVHNLGVIRCTPEQMGAIQARMGLSDGELQDATQPRAADEGMGNVGYLAL